MAVHGPGAQEGESSELLDLNFERILQEERAQLRRQREGRGGVHGRAFSVALSGGGIRAAAFQSGVLWRLAQAGRLKDVEYVAAVSGGGYIATSLASHLLAAEPPRGAAQVDSWYLGVVARSICRMQRNAGDFVRDPAGDPFGFPKDGSGVLPRVFDLPLLLVTLALTLVINPLQILIVYLVPITEAIQLFFGAALRAAFCAPSSADRWYILVNWSPFGWLLRCLEISLVALFVVWLVGKSPLCQLELGNGKGGGRSRAYLANYAMRACLMRVAGLLLLLIVLLLCMPQMEIWEYNLEGERGSNTTRQAFCQHYMNLKGQGGLGQHEGMGCSNYNAGRAWFEDKLFRGAAAAPVAAAPAASGTKAPAEEDFDVAVLRTAHALVTKSSTSVLSAIFSGFLLIMVVATFLAPIFPGLVFTVLSFAGPVAALLLVQLFIQYRTYGPVTGQPLIWDWLPFDHATWNGFVAFCLVGSFLLVPFYNDCQRLWHWYYLRSLQQNFFASGEDVFIQRLSECPQCPLLLLTGTVSDYKPLGATSSISEISFSALHTGSEKTGYVRTPQYRSLAKCAALTAAGCLDAISLSMTHHLRFRFWLEVLNLSWGDYILFKHREPRVVRWAAAKVSDSSRRRLTWLMHRLPNLLLTLLSGSFFIAGWHLAKDSGAQECPGAKSMVATSVLMNCALFVLSFFACMPGLGWLMFSPQYRQFHQATMFHFQAEKPPGLLYVTDGGVQDCTGVVQLLRRRCERILLVLAAADPQDELGVLRAAMSVAAAERLGSFYDPDDPRRDVRILLEEYGRDKSASCLRMGIHYGWGGARDAGGATGMLVVVKNRLPPALEGLPVQPLLTEEEILGGVAWGPRKAVKPDEDCEAGDLRLVDLGGFGCCDCCHRRGCNFGAKFPHLTGANYLWLTPQLFNGLCRLGHEVSQEAVAALDS